MKSKQSNGLNMKVKEMRRKDRAISEEESIALLNKALFSQPWLPVSSP